MLEQLKYKNHMNEVFEFGKDGIYVDLNDLHDYEWTVSKKNNKISAISYNVSKRKLPVTILCETAQQGIAARNKLLEIMEKDVLSMQHGQIIIGDYYFKCFVTKSAKSNYLFDKRYMSLTLTLTSDYPYWVKEANTAFRSSGGGSTGGLDYPLAFPFDYYSQLFGGELQNSNFVSSNFKIVIYGSCTNPAVTIGDHTYQVNCSVDADEYLTIDSTEKKVYITTNTGAIVNKFNDRNKNFYIFEKIKPGQHAVTWNGSYSVDIVLLEERSEPKWT